MVVILTLKRERKSHGNQKTKNIQSAIKMEKCLQRARQSTTESEYFRRIQAVTALGSKALASLDNIPLSRGVGLRGFVGPRCLLGKVGNILGVW